MSATTPSIVKQGNNFQIIAMAYAAATPLIGIDLEDAGATVVAKMGFGLTHANDIELPYTFGTVPAGTTGLPTGQPCVFIEVSRTLTAAMDPKTTYTIDASALYPDGTTAIPLCAESIQAEFSRALE